jgi:NADPH:quinone reductase-like Zn-dependent oxidoreductase
MFETQDHMVLIHVHSFRRCGVVVEFQGVVEGLGEKVKAFKAGDEVCGTADDVFADYVCVPSGSIRHAAHD